MDHSKEMSCNKGQSSVTNVIDQSQEIKKSTQDEVHDHVPYLIGGSVSLQFVESIETNPNQKWLVIS